MVYADGDAVAQALAERIVALATRPVSVEQSTAQAEAVPGLGEADFALSVAGTEPARVVVVGAVPAIAGAAERADGRSMTVGVSSAIESASRGCQPIRLRWSAPGSNRRSFAIALAFSPA